MPIEALKTPEPVVVSTEMRAGRPWWKICCGGCCLFLILAVAGGFLLWRGIGGGRGPVALSDLPSNFPPSITVYRLDQARSIEYFSGADKNKGFAALLSPLRYFGSVMMTTAPSEQVESSSTNPLARFVDVNAARLGQVDTLTIRWKSLVATSDEVLRFYREQFRRNEYLIDETRDEAAGSTLLVARRGDVTAQLLIQDVPDVAGLDSITLIIDYLNQSE
jgi:hypothetical protein